MGKPDDTFNGTVIANVTQVGSVFLIKLVLPLPLNGVREAVVIAGVDNYISAKIVDP